MPVSWSIRESVGVIEIDNPPVNALGVGVPRAVIESLARAERDESVVAVVLIGGGRRVVAGADIRAFERGWPEREPSLRDMIDALERAHKPVVMAMGAHTLGGGLEFAMACRHRIAARDGVMAQPEVNIGIPPGAGGTQRLPRLAGMADAVEMIVFGEPMAAPRARRAGLIDRVSEGDLMEDAIAFAKEAAAAPVPAKPARARGIDAFDPALFDDAEKRAARRFRGRRAPLACIECLKAAARLPFEEGLEFERRRFAECVGSEQATALRHLFFAERRARKAREIDGDARAIEKALVIGAGTMGAGIAACLANAGVPVRVYDADPDALAAGLERIEARLAARGARASEPDAAAHRAPIEPANGLDAARAADIVIEAAFEDARVKRRIFADLARFGKAGAVLATNTSYLDVDEIAAAATGREADVVGMHFFSPADVMKLVEVVRTRDASPSTLATATSAARMLGKIPVIAANRFGFIGNRMYSAYRREATLMLGAGALPHHVDEAMTGFGFAMGPFAASDLAGIDIAWSMRRAFPPDARRRDFPIIERLYEAGRLGRKTARGYYRYDADRRTPHRDPEVERMIVKLRRETGAPRATPDGEAIRERLLYALVNAGAALLGEGVAQRAGDVDLVWVHGYGFPDWLGGPMHWADRVGLPRVLECVERYREHDDYWEPAPLLVELARRNATFKAWDEDGGAGA